MTTTAISTPVQLSTVHKIQLLLKYTFTLVPIAAGLDKFTNILTDWSKYLDPSMVQMLPMSASTFMMIVGIVEIIAGVIVFIKTELGAYIVSAWLFLIALTLLGTWNFPDVAVRDIVMAISAYTLARLTRASHAA